MHRITRVLVADGQQTNRSAEKGAEKSDEQRSSKTPLFDHVIKGEQSEEEGNTSPVGQIRDVRFVPIENDFASLGDRAESVPNETLDETVHGEDEEEIPSYAIQSRLTRSAGDHHHRSVVCSGYDVAAGGGTFMIKGME